MGERGRRRIGRGLLLIGAGLMVWWLWVTVDGLAFQAVVARRLKDLDHPLRARALVEVASATRREADESGILGRIEVPRLGLSAPMIEGTSNRALRRGVGHVEHSAYPGERGNVALAGHRDTWFRKLKGVERGDLIRMRTPDGSFVYAVESFKVVDPERGDLLQETGSPRLTLVTCYPFHWVGPAPRRFVVFARPIEPGDDARASLQAGFAQP
jgi:sortase A